MSKKFTGRGFSARGYYIALILCAAAIGISGYLYYQNQNQDPNQLQDPNPTLDIGNHNDATVDVIAPGPGQTDGPQGGDQPSQPAKKPLKTGMPVSGETVSEYAMDCLSYNETTRDWRTHNGIDIAAEAGTAVCAAADGTVSDIYEDDTMGTTVVITHDGGYETRYSSLAGDVVVKKGDNVILGQAIGCVGSSALLESALGDHLHFTVIRNGESMDPADFFSME
jgi:murein DD-endopeptidase MepM/ murein hydrolase activator NlpD